MRLNKKTLWLIGAAAILVLIVGLVILGSRTSPKIKHPVTESNEVGTVVIDNTDQLSTVLLNEQYTAAINTLVSYIQSKISNKIDHAFVVGTPKVNPDGSVVFTVKTDGVEKRFVVTIDRKTHWDKIVFKVPSTGFSETVQVY